MSRFFCLILAFFSCSFVWAKPFQNAETIYVQTKDGADLKLSHISNPEKPILLALPGLGVKDRSFEVPVAKLKDRFDIYVGNWRGSAELLRDQELYGQTPGLHEVVRYDFQALLRNVIQNASPEQLKAGITLMGHSMGGMMIMGGLSDDALYQEFAPHINTIILLQSPHHLKYISKTSKTIAYAAKPLLDAAQRIGIIAINTHTKFLDFTKSAKHKGSWLESKLAPLIENAAVRLTLAAVDNQGLDFKNFRKAALTISAWSIPLKLLDDFGAAVRGDGHMYERTKKEKLIVPEKIRDIKVVVVMANRDSLAPPKEQKEYFQEIGSEHKILLELDGWGHIKPILIGDEKENFLPFLEKIIATPKTELASMHAVFQSGCEQILIKSVGHID